MPDLRRPVAAALVAGALLAAATGCGSDKKPAYCSDRTTLENAVKDLPNTVKSGGTAGLQTQLKTIESDANALVASAKSDFPSETSTLKTTIEQLKTSVDGLGSSPSAAELTALALNANAVLNAVKGFADATKSAC